MLAGIGIMAIIQASHSHSHGGGHDDHHFVQAAQRIVMSIDSSGADYFEGFSVQATNEDLIPIVDIGNQSAIEIN